MDAPDPMLWFDTDAEQAAALYTSLVANSEITRVERYGEGVPGRNAGEVMTVTRSTRTSWPGEPGRM